MEKIIDTQTTEDADEFGEILREASFKTDKKSRFALGCFSTFTMEDGFIKEECPKDIAKKLMGCIDSKWFPVKEWEEDRLRKCYFYRKGDITVAWYWDRDGTLYVQEGNRAAINYDCKKSHGWDWSEPFEVKS